MIANEHLRHTLEGSLRGSACGGLWLCEYKCEQDGKVRVLKTNQVSLHKAQCANRPTECAVCKMSVRFCDMEQYHKDSVFSHNRVLMQKLSEVQTQSETAVQRLEARLSAKSAAESKAQRQEIETLKEKNKTLQNELDAMRTARDSERKEQREGMSRVEEKTDDLLKVTSFFDHTFQSVSTLCKEDSLLDSPHVQLHGRKWKIQLALKKHNHIWAFVYNMEGSLDTDFQVLISVSHYDESKAVSQWNFNAAVDFSASFNKDGKQTGWGYDLV